MGTRRLGRGSDLLEVDRDVLWEAIAIPVAGWWPLDVLEQRTELGEAAATCTDEHANQQHMAQAQRRLCWFQPFNSHSTVHIFGSLVSTSNAMACLVLSSS